MILSKIKELFIKNKKEILLFSFFIIFIFSIGDNAFAEDAKKTDGMSSVVEGLNLFLGIFSTLLGILSSLVSLLLNPGWVNGTIFGLDVYLKDIWILISNIVYFAFAFILIIISFMNIVGQGGGNWELRSALPKFVVGVIMVPFTWFFIQFILSISAFLTVAVLSLPYDVMSETKVFEEAKDFKICRTFEFNLKTKDGKKVDDTKKLEECTKGKPVKDGVGDYYTLDQLLKGEEGVKGASSSIFSIINIYTYGIMKIQDVQKATKDQLKDIKDIADLTLKVIFDMLFMIVFLLIMIALFMAMFARGVQLWLHAMFSPIYGLLFFFGKSKEGFGDTKLSPLEFINLAMVPVYVAAALAFGMIFMFTAAQGLSEAKSGNNEIFQDLGDGVSGLNIGGFTVKVGGIQGGPTTTNSLFNSLGNGIGQILLEIFGLVILWMAVMAALKTSKVTEDAVAPIAAFGKSIGELAMKAPQYAPIIPTPGGNISASNLGDIGGKAKSYFNQLEQKQATDFMGKHGMFGVKPSDENIRNLITDIKTRGLRKDNIDDLQKQLKGKKIDDIRDSIELKNLLKTTLSSIGKEKNGDKEWNFTDRSDIKKGLMLLHNSNEVYQLDSNNRVLGTSKKFSTSTEVGNYIDSNNIPSTTPPNGGSGGKTPTPATALVTFNNNSSTFTVPNGNTTINISKSELYNGTTIKNEAAIKQILRNKGIDETKLQEIYTGIKDTTT